MMHETTNMGTASLAQRCVTTLVDAIVQEVYDETRPEAASSHDDENAAQSVIHSLQHMYAFRSSSCCTPASVA